MNREERENDVLEQLLRESLASDAEPAGDFTARLMEQVRCTPQEKARKQPYQKILAALAACAVIAVAIPLVMPRASNQAATSADSAAPEMWEEANGADTADDQLVYSTAPTNGGEADLDTAAPQDRKQNYDSGDHQRQRRLLCCCRAAGSQAGLRRRRYGHADRSGGRSCPGGTGSHGGGADLHRGRQCDL